MAVLPTRNVNDPALARYDTLGRSMGIAARALGRTADLYRATGPDDPLAPANRIVRMHAAFTGQDLRFKRPPRHGEATWYGFFDTAYTRPGDYLVQDNAIWFIALQPDLMPPLCVRANRTVGFERRCEEVFAGANGYGGVSVPATRVQLRGWPASMMGINGGAASIKLPATGPGARWMVLLPSSRFIALQPSDIMTDDLGRRGQVQTVEPSEYGWRLAVSEAVP